MLYKEIKFTLLRVIKVVNVGGMVFAVVKTSGEAVKKDLMNTEKDRTQGSNNALPRGFPVTKEPPFGLSSLKVPCYSLILLT